MKKSLLYGVQVALIAIGLVACNQLDQITNTEEQNQQQNTAPTAVAGSDQSVSIGDTVTVNGSASTDADGDTLTYQWTLQSKASGSSASLHDANKAEAWFVADVSGTYTLQLKVSDGTDNDTDDLTVTAEVQTLGDINENTTLHNIFDDPTQADYVVTGVSNVNAVLTIEPGVTIEFGAGARMDVESSGTLTAVGTETDSIFFIGANESPGGWDGINFISNKVANKISYAAVLYGGADSYANVYVDYQSGVTLSHIRSDFSATYGLEADDGAVLRDFAENSFNANTKGALNIPGNLIGSLDALSSYKGTSGQGTIAVYGSDVDVAQTWPAADAPYIMDGVTNVNAAVSVKPGAIFKFTQSSRMDIEGPDGSLAAVGTADSLIQFLGTQATAGYWDGLNFLDNNLANELTYVKVSHGGADSYANVSLNYVAGVKITHSQFTVSSTYGLDVDDGGQLREFAENTFEADAGVRVPGNLIGSLDALSSYKGTSGQGTIAVYGSDVDVAQTWPAADAPYIMDGVTNVNAAVSVKPGAIFKFTQSSRMDIEEPDGSLAAVGTADSLIQFLGTQATAGYWDGLNFLDNNLANELTYVKVSHGGMDSYANVLLNYVAGVKITHSQFTMSSTYGIDVDSGGELRGFANNTFAENAIVHIPAYLMGSLDEASSYIGNGTGYIAVYGDDINADQTWPATDAPFRVDGIVNIYADVVVAPGATVQFSASARVDIDSGTNGGSLKAVGTSIDSIKFVGVNDVQGSWDGLYFMTNTPNNQLQYCVVANAGYDSYADVAVNYTGSVSVTNSTLRDSKTYGIEVDSGGSLTQSGNTFINNLLGDVMLH